MTDDRRAARRPTFRVRLTIAFGSVALGSAALVIALVSLFMAYVPHYALPMIDIDAESMPTLPMEQDGTMTYEFVIASPADVPEVILRGGGLALVIVTALAAWIGWVLSGRLLRPLSRINEAARRAGDGDLTHRIRLDGPRDEVRELADTFDHTLDRLQRAFEAHRRFAANAAHELRTPLTATKTLLDIAAAHPAAIAPADLIAGVRHDNDRSIELVQALLMLTTLEATTAVLGDVDLADLAAEALHRAAAAESAFEYVGELGPAPTRAERPLVALVLDNLLQNAQRHNDARAYIRVRTGSAASGSWVEVENTGEAIAYGVLEKLTEPLFRVRRTASDGHGLGLAIVRSVLDRHDAALRLTPRHGGGLVVTAFFPYADAVGEHAETGR